MSTSKLKHWSLDEKHLLVEEAPTWKTGKLDLSQIHLAGWPGDKKFNSKGGEGGRSMGFSFCDKILAVDFLASLYDFACLG